MSKRSENDLIRLAFIYGQQDRESYAQCWPPGSPERAEAKALARELRAYRLKRWGATRLEVALSEAESVSVEQVMSRARR